MIRLFCGYDQREEPGLHVFTSSVLRHTSALVDFVPLNARGLAQGSNAFTMSRFLVAELCHFRGRAIFADASDMIVLDDIAALDSLFDPRYAVQVVKHPAYFSRHERKYVGVPSMECKQSNYSRKNWASVMLVNCEHPRWRNVSAQARHALPLHLLQLTLFGEDDIGELPARWNVIADEGQDAENAALLHWTAGVPYFPHYRAAPRAELWLAAAAAAGVVPPPIDGGGAD